MNEFEISANECLSESVRAFYHVPYVGMGNPGNPDYLNDLKNTFNNFPNKKLKSAANELKGVLLIDFPQIIRLLKLRKITVCVVPRAKAEKNYSANQLLFKTTVSSAIEELNGFEDGTDYLRRHTNTKTTHLWKPVKGYNNDGKDPYPGITVETCDISKNVKGRNILLVDDIYTETVDIDEDAIQSLIDAGARSVYFYAVGRTV